MGDIQFQYSTGIYILVFIRKVRLWNVSAYGKLGAICCKFFDCKSAQVDQLEQCLVSLENVWEELGISISDVDTSFKSVPTDSWWIQKPCWSISQIDMHTWKISECNTCHKHFCYRNTICCWKRLSRSLNCLQVHGEPGFGAGREEGWSERSSLEGTT